MNADEISQFKKDLSANAYFETSAKNGTNVKNVFDILALEMYKDTHILI